MKKRIFCMFGAALLLCGVLTGCGKKQAPAALTAETVAAINTILKLPPEKVPKKGWTERTLEPVLYVGTTRLLFPCYFKDMGGGFSASLDSDAATYEDGTAYCQLLLDGCEVGTIRLIDCPSRDALKEGRVEQVTIKIFDYPDKDHPAPSVFPVSVNGVTIGSPYDDIEKKLGMKKDNQSRNNDGYFYVAETVGRYKLQLSGNIQNGTDSITVTDEKAGTGE